VPIRDLLSEYPTRRSSLVCFMAAQGILDALPPRFVPSGEREGKAISIIAERLGHGDTDGFSLCWHLEQAGIVHGCSRLVAALELHAESEVDLALEQAIAEWMVRHEPSEGELPPAPGLVGTWAPTRRSSPAGRTLI
jgi:hypothetical protein